MNLAADGSALKLFSEPRSPTEIPTLLKEVSVAVKAWLLSGFSTRQAATEMITTIKYRAMYRM